MKEVIVVHLKMSNKSNKNFVNSIFDTCFFINVLVFMVVFSSKE